MRVEIRRSGDAWDVLEGDRVLARTDTRASAIQRAAEHGRVTGQVLQIIAPRERRVLTVPTS